MTTNENTPAKAPRVMSAREKQEIALFAHRNGGQALNAPPRKDRPSVPLPEPSRNNRERVLAVWPNAGIKWDGKVANVITSTLPGAAVMTLGSGMTEREAWRHARRHIDRENAPPIEVSPPKPDPRASLLQELAIADIVNACDA